MPHYRGKGKKPQLLFIDKIAYIQLSAFSTLADLPQTVSYASYYWYSLLTLSQFADHFPFKQGDIIELEIDCKQNKLVGRNTSRGISASFTLPDNATCQLMVCMRTKNDSVCLLESKYLARECDEICPPIKAQETNNQSEYTT